MAYTYTGTPNQRIQQAQQRISNDGSVAINPTLSAYMQAAQQEQTEEQAVEQQNNANFGVRLGDTLGDVAKNTLDGMLKAGEGLLDFGAGAVGMFAGWFGNEDLKQRASDWAARDLVSEMWESGRQRGLDVDFEDSYINEMSETGRNIVRGVAQGVGQMLPMVAVTALTAGAGGAAAAAGKISATAAKGLAKAGQVANLVGLGASAAGTSTEQALNTDIVDAEGNVTRPTLDRAFLYGLASGAVEMATEKLVGGVFEKFTGTGLADKVINKLSKSVKFGKAVQFGLNVVGEGVEEMVSEAVGKTLETIYNSSDGKMHWESPDMQDVIVSGIVGSLTAAVIGGADVGVRKISPTQSVQDAMLDYENSKKKADNLQRQGKLTEEDIAKFDAENASTLDKVSRRYQKASEKTRTKMLETMPGLADLIDIKDGSVKKSVLSDGATEITAQQATQAMSGSLAVSRRTEVANALHERNLSIATNLDEVQRANMLKLEKALKLTGKKSGVGLKVVVAESMPDNAHLDGDIMYISKDRLSSSDSTAQDFSHEAFHFAEGTKEYRAMYDFLRSIKLNGESLVDTAIDKVRNLGYEVDDTIYDKIKNRESLAGQDARQVELALSEINAKAAELLFGDAETIDKLVDRDRSLARKVLSNMRDYAKIIENVFKGEKDSVEPLKQMRKGIKLFEDALAASGEDYLRGKSIEHQQSIKNDIKHSLRENATDSQGRTLSQEQAEFFKDSKVRDENGNLLVVYHGTPNGNFFTFEYNKSRQTGTDYGKAFYFTTNLKNAKGYAKDNHKDARIKEYELKRESLKKQILAETDTTKRQELEKQFRNVKVDGKSILEILYDVDYDTGGEVRQVYLNLVNPLIADAQKKYHYEVYPELFKQAIKNGNDGIIVRNVDDSSKFGVGLSDVYIAFFPEQIKLTTNEMPTANPDIRYSLRENATDSEGRKLSKKQLEFFKDSKVVDKDGNLLVVYHGTKSDFTIFDKSKGGESNSIADIGFWFTTSKQGAERWAENAWWGDNEQGKAMAAYLKIENPKIYETTDNDSKEVVLKERDLHQKRSKIASKYLYDIDRNNSTTGVAEWDAFRVIVENYDKKTQSFYLDKLSPDKRENVTRDAEEYKTIYAEEEELGKEISRLHFTRDGYEKFRADMYSLTGQSAEDANFNGNGFALKNAQETKELFVKQLKEQGYDGLIIHTDFDANSFGLHNTQYVVFDANQIKSIDNLNPTANPDIRYSLREKPIFNDKKSKTKLIERLDGMQLDYYGKYFAHIEDASKFFSEDTNADRLATQIIAMANQNDESVRYAYADDLSTAIINNMVVTDVDPQRLSDITGLSDAMRQYMHKLNLTADIMAEVKSKYGEKEARTIRLIWGSAKDASVKISVDDAASELQSRGYTFQSDNVADQFLEMLDVIEESRNLASRELSKTAKQLLSPEEYDSLQEEIRDDILSFMEENGTAKEWSDYVRSAEREANMILEQARQKAEEKTKLATLEAQLAEEKAKHAYDKQVKELEGKIRDIEVSAELRAADDIEYNKEYHRLVDKVWSEAVSLSADNLKKYNNASDLMNKEFASVVKKLAGIKYRGELKKGATRRIIADFGKWYNVNNPLLTGGLDAQTIEMMMNDASVENIGYLDKFTLNAIETISENQTREAKSGKYKGQKVENNKPLSADELRLVSAVLGSARHVLKNYNTVEVNKKKIVLSDAAIKANKQAQAIAPHVKKHTRIGENVSNAIKSIIDPTALIGEMFGYQDNNPLVDSFKDIQEGATHAQYLTNSFTDIIDDFTKSHKSYKKHLADKIKVSGHEIRVDVALSLYMLSQQADSINGLKNGGWGYVDEKGYWIDCGKLTDSDISSLYDDFTKADKDFLNVARKFFDATGKAMAETDIQYRGYTLINADAKSDYFPITRYSGDMSKPIADAEATKSAMQVSVANYSFTKERVKNERRITVSPILNVISKHAREVGNYCGLAIPIKEFQRIYNCNIGENGATKSIRNTINEQSWSGFNSYITTLLEDIQGISREKNSLANKALNLIRSNIATFALGFNIKTILSQISGYPAASMYVSLDSMAKAMAHSTWYKGTNAQNMLIYSEWAAVKAHDNGLILAETASEKLGKVANMTTVGIQMMDNWMNRLIWNACQCEVEKRTGLKFGTKENMIEAGKLHAEVGRMTQGNNARSELSAMQRSSNALAKMYSMFNSDGFKYISRLYEAAKRASAYKYLNKTNPGTISQQKVKSAHVFMAKAATAIIVSNLVYVLMGQLMKFTLNKDREDEEGNEISFWQDLGMDFASSMVGMIPIVRDIYSLVVEGYDVKDNATEGIMNLAESIKGVIESSMTMIKGDVWDSTDIAKPLKSLIDAIGQVTGIPTRNLYNYVYGFTKRFSPSTAYEWNSIFYNNGYTKDLKKAMQKDDVDLQKTIIGLMLKDDGMTDTSEQVNNRLRELYAQGYTVLPRTVKDTLNYNGETYSLSKNQQTAFKATYGQANKEVEELIESRSFSTLSAEIQARAIKWIYDYYYEKAVFETVGEDADSKNQLFGEVMDIPRFAMTIAACKSVESKVDKKGNVIAGSKKQAILQLLRKLSLSNNEILMILAYLGYSIDGNEQVIKNFISRIGLTRSQQKSLLQYCGIAA